ncbi:rhodanese family protein [Hyphomonas sp.]|uniref:rhodanese family protein n=1 Tax=Hyphomonas sp. TaxID=87 RepID=UPI00391B2DD8
MTTLTKIDPKTLAEGLKAGRFHLIDIREADEHAREHIAGAASLPLSKLEESGLRLGADKSAVFHCKSGMRTEANCARLADKVDGEALLLAGGLDAWKQAGLPVVTDTKAPLPMNRQVQITAGLLVLTGVLVGTFVHPAGYALSGFIGAGLTFAGISGWCGMANVLAVMPWNRTAAA